MSPSVYVAKLYRNLLLLLVVAAILMVTGVVSVSADSERSTVAITIFADGETYAVTTDAETVGEVLERAEIEVNDKDLVEPSLDRDISSDTFAVNVYRSRPVIVVDEDGGHEKVETAHRSKRNIAQEAESFEIYDEDEFSSELITDFLDAQYVGYRVIVERATPLNLIVSGETSEIRTHAETVADVFEERDIDVEDEDEVDPSLDTAITNDMDIRLTRIGYESVTEEKEIAYDTEEVRDNDMPLGQQEVESEGSPGLASITYDIKYEDGEEVRREEISRNVIEEPVTRVVVVGNQNSYSADTEKLLRDLRMCEAGGRYDANTGNGFYGAYQFMISTWDRVAPMVGRSDLVGVRPDQASPADQDFMVIENAKLSAGGFHSQHPGCSQSLGLPKFP